MKLELKPVSVNEAIVRSWVSGGRRCRFSINDVEWTFILRLKDQRSVFGSETVQTSFGPVTLHPLCPFIQSICDIPVFSEAIKTQESWFWELINARINETIKDLFGFFAPDEGKEMASLPVEITLASSDSKCAYLGHIPMAMIERWMNENKLESMPMPYSEGFPLFIPLIVGRFTLSSERCQQLNIGDVLLPTNPLLNTDGQGFLVLGDWVFDFELEPDPENSHKYKLHITAKNGSDTMNQIDGEQTDFETDADGVEGELLKTVQGNGFNDLPIELTIRCGNLSLTLGELQNLDAGSTLMVEHVTPGEALLCHGNYLLAKGELVNVNGALGLQIKSMLRAMPGQL